MKFKLFMASSLLLTMSFQAKAANMVLAAENLKCGGYITLEKTPETLVVLRAEIPSNNVCAKPLVLEIKSQSIRGEVQVNNGTVELNPHAIGAVLPISIGDETILMKLSDQSQKEVQSSNTREDLAQAQSRQKEIEKRTARNNAAAAGAAILVGGGVVAAEGAASAER